jgi:hypothetical protein
MLASRGGHTPTAETTGVEKTSGWLFYSLLQVARSTKPFVFLCPIRFLFFLKFYISLTIPFNFGLRDIPSGYRKIL